MSLEGRRTQIFVMIFAALVVICMAAAVGVLYIASHADDGQLIRQAELFSFSVLPTVHAREQRDEQPWEPEAVYTMDLVYETFEGTEVGKMTFAALCRQLDVEPNYARLKLLKRGVRVSSVETLGGAARRYGVNPIALLQALLVGEKVRGRQRRIDDVPRLRPIP